MDDEPILLSGYAAKHCARRVHNEWDATIPKMVWEPAAELQLRFDRGREFEDEVFAALMQALGPERCVDLSPIVGKGQAIAATVEAMDAGVEVVLGGWLPDDLTGGRTGRPDLLVRHGDRGPDNRYLPGDVKWHKMTKASAKATLRYSTPSEPAVVNEAPGLTARVSDRVDDFFQLAHYWRMLEACRRAPEAAPAGAIIGTDVLTDLDPTGRVLVWLDLATPLFTTFSRSQGTVKRSALERYDHELAFRLKVARVAVERTGAPDDPAPLVEPVIVAECESCAWNEYCLDLLGEDSASARITSGRLSVREWRALAALGVTTVAELAALEVTHPVFTVRYLPEVTDQPKALERVADAVRRARMLESGVTLDRQTSGAIDVPRADVEVDFDTEWDAVGRVYLWGARVETGAGVAAYTPTVSWDVLDADAERRLAEDFVAWLRGLIAEAADAGQTLLVYHYTEAETTQLKRVLGKAEVADLFDRFVDLYPIVKEHYFGLHGLGIKKVAPVFGFEWRDDDPGGLQSQLWLEEARAATDPTLAEAARRRILAYNEDDVAATAALREGMAKES